MSQPRARSVKSSQDTCRLASTDHPPPSQQSSEHSASYQKAGSLTHFVLEPSSQAEARSSRLLRTMSLPEGGMSVPTATQRQPANTSLDTQRLISDLRKPTTDSSKHGGSRSHSGKSEGSAEAQHPSKSQTLPKTRLSTKTHKHSEFSKTKAVSLPDPESPGPTERQVSFGDTRDSTTQKLNAFHTGRYPKNVRAGIRHRIAIESWMNDVISGLYSSAEEDHNCEMDVDDLLDQDTDEDRRAFVQDKVADAKQSPQVVNQFIDELLQKLRTL